MGVLVEIKACWINSKWIKPKQVHTQASKYRERHGCGVWMSEKRLFWAGAPEL